MSDRDPALPHQSLWWYRWFLGYCRKYAAKNFHAVRLSKTSVPVVADGSPLIFVVNHPSWWDAIIGIILTGQLPSYRHYSPMEAGMFRKYRFFARLGFFELTPTPRGAAMFLRTAKALFANPNHALWVTAQGRFSDPRERPIILRPGVGGVAARMTNGFIIPVAIEYPYWNEKTPECLVRFGTPLLIAENPERETRDWITAIEVSLTETMDVLAREAITRDPALFNTLIRGKVGIGGVYDRWRRCAVG